MKNFNLPESFYTTILLYVVLFLFIIVCMFLGSIASADEGKILADRMGIPDKMPIDHEWILYTPIPPFIKGTLAYDMAVKRVKERREKFEALNKKETR